MLKHYLVYLPLVRGSPEEEWEQCRKQIPGALHEGNRLVKLNIFVDQTDYSSFLRIRNSIDESLKESFCDQCPAFNITVHPPEKPWKITVEAGFVSTFSSTVVSKIWHSIPYIVRVTDTEKEVWAGGLGAGLFPDDTRKAATAAFDQMRAILYAEKISFDHIVRQWNFIGNILEVKNGIQNYQIFNEVRSESYHKYRNVHSYPAATGVGMKYGGVNLDFYAVKAERNLKIIAIDNPDQIRPYGYSQQVLKGKPVGSRTLNQPPQFERAVFIADSLSSTLFVSGTASIIGQDTIGIEDIGRQTVVTIENISKLTDSKRLGHLTGKTDTNAGKLILLRVYIKKQEDFAKVKEICNEFHPCVPVIYIEADICRDNLLVEMEAEFSKIN